MTSALWYAGAPRPMVWGTGGCSLMFARRGDHTWFLTCEDPARYTALPLHEFAVVVPTGPLRQVAEIVHGLVPDVEQALLHPLLEPTGPAPSDLRGRRAIAVSAPGGVFLGLAMDGSAHTLFTAAAGGAWLSGLVAGEAVALVRLEPTDAFDLVADPVLQ